MEFVYNKNLRYFYLLFYGVRIRNIGIIWQIQEGSEIISSTFLSKSEFILR